MSHSTIVGGSTAKRVLACPGSVALCATMPPRPNSIFADKGTLLHEVIVRALEGETDFVGATYANETFSPDMMVNKIQPALALLDEVDPSQGMDYVTEAAVTFGSYIPGAFGTVDLLARRGDTAIVLDWKFGDGVLVEAEENEQLMFYAAAAMRTPGTKWAFEGAAEIECVIIQPPFIKRWTTTSKHIRAFERALKRAVTAAAQPDAVLAIGSHCRWCAAKPVCPQITGAVERAVKTQLLSLDTEALGAALKTAEVLEGWIGDLRSLATRMLEGATPVPGWKLVAKRATRRWIDENKAITDMEYLGIEPRKVEIISPAQAEKLLQRKLPDGLTVSVSSGNTLAAEADPRPEALLLGKQLSAALNKLGAL